MAQSDSELANSLKDCRNEVIIISEGGKYKIASILGGAGLIAGLVYAFRRQSSGWGYVGYGMLGSIIGGTLGRIIGTINEPAEKNV